MPIYEYKCSECGAHFEKMQKVSDETLSVCEVCGGKLEKQWSLSGFQFKGAGWYVTDYSNKLKETGAGNSDKTEKAGTTAVKSDNSEKSSPVESTAKTESASNTMSETAASSKTETTVKKD